MVKKNSTEETVNILPVPCPVSHIHSNTKRYGWEWTGNRTGTVSYMMMDLVFRYRIDLAYPITRLTMHKW